MDRINGLYTALVGGLRQWRNKNVAAGLNGTQFDQVFQNDLQEELCQGIITFAGGTPTAGVQNQLRTYLATMMAPSPIYIGSSGNVTVPVWATRCLYKLLGGGASGAVGTGGDGGGGGGAGGYCEGVATGLVGGVSIPVTIGAGGVPSGGGAGMAGGTTSFGSFASATGGYGGSSSPPAGGPSGSGAGGSRNEGLGDGFDGVSGSGGHGGGAGGRGTTSSIGAGGVGGGGGGGGCVAGYSSGAGHAGLAILEWLP